MAKRLPTQYLPRTTTLNIASEATGGSCEGLKLQMPSGATLCGKNSLTRQRKRRVVRECMKTTKLRSKCLMLLAAMALQGLLSAGCSNFYVIKTCISVEDSSDLEKVVSERANPDRINIIAGYYIEDGKKRSNPISLRLERMIRLFFDRKKLSSGISFLDTVKDRDNLTISMTKTSASQPGVGSAFVFGATLGLTGIKTSQDYEFQASFQSLDGGRFEKTYRLTIHNATAPRQAPSGCEVIATTDAKLDQETNHNLIDWKLTEKFLTLLIADLQSEGYLQ